MTLVSMAQTASEAQTSGDYGDAALVLIVIIVALGFIGSRTNKSRGGRSASKPSGGRSTGRSPGGRSKPAAKTTGRPRRARPRDLEKLIAEAIAEVNKADKRAGGSRPRPRKPGRTPRR